MYILSQRNWWPIIVPLGRQRIPLFLNNLAVRFAGKVMCETVRFKVEGSESNLRRLQKAIEIGVEEYNT